MKATTRAHLSMLVYAFLVSTSFTIGKSITTYMAPDALTCLRFCVASCVFSLLALLRGEFVFPGFRALGRYLLLSSTMVGFFVAMFAALRYTSALSTSAIFTLVPLESAALAWLLLRQGTPLRRLLWMGLGGLGALWILFRGSLEALLALELGWGEFLFFVGTLSFAAYSPLVRKLNRGESVLQMNLWTLWMGTLLLGVIAASDLAELSFRALPWKVVLGIGWLGILNTAVTFFIAKYASMHLPSAKVMSYTYLTPGFVVLLQLVLGGGWPPGAVVPGLVLAATATWLLQKT